MLIKLNDSSKLELKNISDDIFVKNNDFNVKDIYNFLKVLKKSEKEAFSKRDNKIITTSVILFGLPVFCTLIKNLDFNIILSWCMIVMLPFVASTCGLLTGLFFSYKTEKILPFKTINLLKLKKKSFIEQFTQKLEEKSFQGQILLYLNNLETSDKNIDDKEYYTEIKEDLIIYFHDNDYEKAQDYLLKNIFTLYELEEKIFSKSTKENKIDTYLQDLKKETNITLIDLIKEDNLSDKDLIDCNYRNVV